VLNEVLGWLAIGTILAGTVVVLGGLYTWPRGERCRCPGPRPRRVGLVNPVRLLRRGRCWYNLTGLIVNSLGQVRCPECGRLIKPRRALADGRRLRILPTGTAMLLAGLAAFGVTWRRNGAWTAAVPTLPLVVLAGSQDSTDREALRRELDRRVADGSVTGWPATLLARSLARDLESDDVHWNAERAERMLESLWPHSQPALESALRSGDAQARIIATRLLQRRVFPPTDDLLRASIEDLRDDAGEVRYYISLRNAKRSSDYLVNWADIAEPFLIEAMASDDPQQRLLAAAVLGYGGRVSAMDRAVPILVSHLRDNDVRGDAKVAAPALYRFGSDVLPHLRRHVETEDDQARAILRSIIEQLEHPDRSIYRLDNPMPKITDTTGDPLRNLSIGRGARDLSW
jgi:hypothetical protein